MIQDGSKVSFHYKLAIDGQPFESSESQEPLTYTHGQGEIVPGLEEALAGLDVGDKKNVELPPEQAYGPHDPDAVHAVPRDRFRDPDSLNEGDVIRGQQDEGEFHARVLAVGPEEITLDMNHPLAGRTLAFEVEIVEVA